MESGKERRVTLELILYPLYFFVSLYRCIAVSLYRCIVSLMLPGPEFVGVAVDVAEKFGDKLWMKLHSLYEKAKEVADDEHR